jgi:hypothetical protein
MKEFHLFIFAFDDLTYKVLSELCLGNATIIPLSDFENTELLKIKETRTKVEYFWTCTSSTIAYSLDKFGLESCTYLDADLFFFGSPEELFAELKNGKDVLITEHRYSASAKLFEKKRAGRFCVQFMTFSSSESSLKILHKWIDQCIEWCYSRYEDGKFGDQKYLENWPEEYSNVHVLNHLGGGIAPWNASDYKFLMNGEGLKASRNGNGFSVIFFHFHYVRIIWDNYADLGWNILNKNIIETFYIPYINNLAAKENFLEERFSAYRKPVFREAASGLKAKLKSAFKRITRFNILDLK